MLLSFKVKNFKSIKEELLLDFKRKSKEKLNEEVISDNYLKVVSLIGINGVGKTSLLKALDMMRYQVLISHNYNVNTRLNCPSFINGDGDIISFEIIFIEKGEKYEYNFSYNKEKFLNEKVYIYSSKKKSLIFKRQAGKYIFGTNYKNELQKRSEDVISKTLMVSRAVQLNSKVLKPIYDFFF